MLNTLTANLTARDVFYILIVFAALAYRLFGGDLPLDAEVMLQPIADRVRIAGAGSSQSSQAVICLAELGPATAGQVGISQIND